MITDWPAFVTIRCSRLLRQQQLEAMGGAGEEASAGEPSSSSSFAKEELSEVAEHLSRPRARGGRKEPAASEGGGEEAGGSGRVSPSPDKRLSPPNNAVFPSPLLKSRPSSSLRRATASPSPHSCKRSKMGTPTSPATEERVIMLADKPKTLRTVERLGGTAEGAAHSGDEGAAHSSDEGAAHSGDEGATLKLALPLAWKPLTVTPPESDRMDGCVTPGALSAEMH